MEFKQILEKLTTSDEEKAKKAGIKSWSKLCSTFTNLTPKELKQLAAKLGIDSSAGFGKDDTEVLSKQKGYSGTGR